MKRFCLSSFLTFSLVSLLSQSPAAANVRSQLLPQYAPFYHGVASGDPLPDKVILWTRITPANPGVQNLNWAVATDTGMTQIVRQGTANTDLNEDYTVHVDVDSLQAGTWYFYRFEQNGRHSLVGRTRTAPQNQADSIRLGIVSCSSYPQGYFNVYGALANRNDVHAVLHLGDYIYEGGGGTNDFSVEPSYEILNLEDYRLRHSHYKLDNDLRRLHQVYPFIQVWDDHETSNDSWMHGSQNHDPLTEGDWELRKFAGTHAWRNWQPVRIPDPNDSLRIYRKFTFGTTLDLYMLDTRLIGRDSQVGPASALITDTTRYLLGQAQLNWLKDGVDSSNAKWQILGQQVMMAPLMILGNPLTADQWDGYQGERNRIYNLFQSRNIQNLVVLTGDIHSAWASDLPLPLYNSNTGDSAAGVEFVGTSVTSTGPSLPLPLSFIQAQNNHIQYANTSDHGYYVLDVNDARAQCDYYYVNSISTQNTYAETLGESWMSLDGEGHLRQASGPATLPASTHYVMPPTLPANPVSRASDFISGIIVGTYPNPFFEGFYVTYNLFEKAECILSLKDVQGKEIWNKNLGLKGTDHNFEKVEPGPIPAGIYLLSLTANQKTVSWRVIKSE